MIEKGNSFGNLYLYIYIYIHVTTRRNPFNRCLNVNNFNELSKLNESSKLIRQNVSNH